MDSADVFAKTADGQHEVATRARQLPARQRSMLIMIDGKRSLRDMLAHHPNPEEARASLEALLSGGLIEVVARAEAPTPVPVPKPEKAPASTPPPVNGDIKAIKRYICTTLHDHLGPDADLFTGKVESAPTMEALMAQAEKMREVLRGAAGSKKAEQFWEKLGTMISSA